MEIHLKVSTGSEPLKKAIGVAKRQSRHQKISIFSACKAQGSQHKIGLFLILSIELELACNGGSCGGISLKIFACEKIALHEPRLQTSSSSIPRIRNKPIRIAFFQCDKSILMLHFDTSKSMLKHCFYPPTSGHLS